MNRNTRTTWIIPDHPENPDFQNQPEEPEHPHHLTSRIPGTARPAWLPGRSGSRGFPDHLVHPEHLDYRGHPARAAFRISQTTRCNWNARSYRPTRTNRIIRLNWITRNVRTRGLTGSPSQRLIHLNNQYPDESDYPDHPDHSDQLDLPD